MKPYIYKILIIIIIATSSLIAGAQELDEIIAKHIEAHGGTENWDKIESMEITGRFTAFSEEDDFQAIKTSNGEYYSELSLGQHEVIESFDGSKGWTIDPWHEISFPRELKNSEISVFVQKAEFFTPFYKYKEKGYLVELLGKQEVDGIDTYAIKLTKPNGDEENWFLDSHTYLEYKCESSWVDFTYPAPAESYFEDFRSINGVILPYYIERTFFQRNRIIQIEDIEFNIDVDPTLFIMPKSEEIEKLAFLEGKWDVKVSVNTRRGWYEYDNTVSNIEFTGTNLLTEKSVYELNFVFSVIINYSYNMELEEYVVTVFNNFTSDINVYSGNFNDTSFVVTRADLNCSDTTQSTPLSKFAIHQIKDDSFTIEVSSSGDNGETWTPRQKLDYIRKSED